jgi:hypothetical protein
MRDAAAAAWPVPASEPWIRRRLFPLVATAGLILVGISITIWWGPGVLGLRAWALPHDLWGTLIAASRLLHGDLGGLYTAPTGLITLPGGAIILVPVVAVIQAAGVSLQVQSAHNPQPTAWLLAGPYMTAISGVALFAADTIAEHLGVIRRRRALLAAGGVAILWSVSVRWGHPEDAVAVGLLLYAVLALAKGKPNRSAWLMGAAIAVQPLVLLALPVLLAVIRPRRVAAFLAGAAVPGVVLLGAAALANWSATFAAVAKQPNWPTINHPTLWLPLATPLGNGAVAAGPVRLIAVVVACGCAVAAARQCRAARQLERWDSLTLLQVLWWVAVALALRSLFEPVMVAFYIWPVLAVALITATTSWTRLAWTTVLAIGLTFFAQGTWRSPWTWWLPIVAGLGITLALARVPAAAPDLKAAEPPPPAAYYPPSP